MWPNTCDVCINMKISWFTKTTWIQCNAGDKIDFTRGNLSPNLQARFCKLYPADFVGWNWVIQVNSGFQKMEIKDRFSCTQCSGAVFRWVVASKVRALGAAENAPDPVWKNPGKGLWTKRKTTNPWKQGTPEQINCNRKIGRIELAESSLQIWV